MTQHEIPTEEAIVNVPTPEIARNLARLERARFAFDQAPTMPDDGEIAWMLAQAPRSTNAYLGTYWEQSGQREMAYETLLIDSLHNALNLKAVTQAAKAPFERIDIRRAPAPDAGTERRDLGRVIYDQARIEALGRLGLVSIRRRKVNVPLGALAALHYARADIRSITDRTLYERADDIDMETNRLLSEVSPRQVEITVLGANTARTGMEHKQMQVSVFSTPESSARWWQEISHDLQRIDEASGSS